MSEPVAHDPWDFLLGGGETGALIAGFDWAATALGPPGAWPERLKSAVSILLGSPVAMMLLWGPEGVVIYNDAYARMMGRAHPTALGQKVRDVWPDLVEVSGRFLGAGLAGRTFSLRDQELGIDRSGHREQAWFDLDGSPVRDDRGEPAGVLIVAVETTQRVLAQRKAVRELERQQRTFEQAPGFICYLRGPDLIVEYTNAAHRRLFGVEDAEGRPYMEAFAAIAGRGRPEVLFEAYRSGQRYIARAEPVLVPGRDGGEEEHLLDLVLEPVFDDDGQVMGLFLEGFDVTEQVRAQRAADDSERRLSAALAVARLGAFESYVDTQTGAQTLTLDARAKEILAFAPDETVTLADVAARVDPADYARLQAEAAAAAVVGVMHREYEFRIHLPDGSVRHIAGVSDRSPSEDGLRQRIIGALDDVTERRAAERRQRMLINELNHRVKNTLATVQSLAAQTLRSAPDVASVREDFESRLVALAGAHDLLTAESWHGARLADVVAAALAPFETARRPQISRTGPPVWLAAQQALALSLALHELAANAAKYGALSRSEGRVSVSWTVRGEELTLRWVETGGPPAPEPARAGFGSRLLQRSLPRELGGDVEWTFAAEGVRCEIRCKVRSMGATSPLEVAQAAGREGGH